MRSHPAARRYRHDSGGERRGQTGRSVGRLERFRDATLAKRVQVKGESVKRLPPQLEDEAYDLDESGKWERVEYQGEVREVWRPAAVQESWQPFTVGRWTDYYGDQVWIPEESFGYVTMHYGNWILVGNSWYWAPPAPVVGVAVAPIIPWYPGRVAWISSGPNAGWVPLAPTEVYYAHHLWGPAAVVVAPGAPVVSISIGRLAFLICRRCGAPGILLFRAQL